MKFELLHPREQLVEIINRTYTGGMTTLSGGNISILDDDGRVWITPAGIDKGNLQPDDIVQMDEKGKSEGRHKPSSEYPFHRAIYNRRPDFRAIVHSHPPGLIAYSIAKKIPKTQAIPHTYAVCGPIGFSPYAMTGSEKLGENIAATLGEGYNLAILENHGVVSGGASLLEAFQRMETLEFCAQTLINAHQIGNVQTLSDDQLKKFTQITDPLAEVEINTHGVIERELRKIIVEIVHRAYQRKLMCSKEGVVSARIDDQSFLITPTRVDRFHLTIEDLVLIKDGHREKGKHPSRAAHLHQKIYQEHPNIHSIISSQSPYAMAFAVTGKMFDSHTIPESYIMLREVMKIDYDTYYDHPGKVVQTVSTSSPVLLIKNDSVLACGSSVLEAYDRLEVLEYSARALLAAQFLGGLIPIDQKSIKEIEDKFFKP
jgi:L-fuculose-phosphate aldolase